MDHDDETPSTDDRESRRAERKRRREEEREAAPTVAKASVQPSGGAGGVTADRERVGPAQFLREVRGELKKVAWPSRSEVLNYTLVVLVVTIFLTLLVFGMDFVIRNITVEIFG